MQSLLEEKAKSWKESAQAYSVKIIGHDKSEKGEVYIKHFTPAQRKLRLIKSFIIWWGIALVCVFIPIAHFFLVPLFILLGLIMPFNAYNKTSVVLGGAGTCPYCAKAFEIANAADRFPLQDICESCHRHVKIEKASA